MKVARLIKGMMMFGLIVSSSMLAHTDCDPGMQTVLTCKSTPHAGDNAILAQMADQIDICPKDGNTYIILEAEGGNSGATKVEPMVTVGATNYDLADDHSIEFSARCLPKNVNRILGHQLQPSFSGQS